MNDTMEEINFFYSETDKFFFKEDLESRRINITYLFVVACNKNLIFSNTNVQK